MEKKPAVFKARIDRPKHELAVCNSNKIHSDKALEAYLTSPSHALV